ncbi:MAG: hypothetical protein M3177_02115 [Pseudomonadota bacterium]|nr:hypothetical protein [Pseudomonadota bacterium]
MRGLAFLLGAALTIGGCTVASEEDQLENAIRENLANQGTVQEVQLTKQDENNMTGYVMIRENSGRSGRLNCTAQRSSGNNFNWRCSPAIDEQVLTEMENVIREELAKQATVVSVEMSRQGDDNHMSGFAVVRDEAGNEVRANCTAERDSTNTGSFNWECQPAEEGQAAEGGDTGGK